MTDNQKPHKVIKIGLIHSMPSPIIVESQKNTFPFLSLYDKKKLSYFIEPLAILNYNADVMMLKFGNDRYCSVTFMILLT